MKIYKLSIISSALVLSVNANASSILVSNGNTFAYGLGNWSNMTAEMDGASGGNIDITVNFESLTQMLNYDALWLDQRHTYGSLSVNEVNNITSFINTGRRVVMVGENDSWLGWNNQILGIVGSAYNADTSGSISTVVSNEITSGVTSINAGGSAGTALGGTSLFSSNVVTLWGDGNVLTMLDAGICSDGRWAAEDDATFCGNVANWVAASTVSAVPVPAAIWLFGSGLIALMGFAKRRQNK